MLYVDNSTCQSGEQLDLGVVEKIIIFPLETRMWFDLDLELHISRKNTRHLVAITFEVDLGTALHALVNVDVKNLSFADSFPTSAFLAPIFIPNDLSFTLAIGADCLKALDHRSHLTHHHLHSRSLAASAGLDRTFLASTPFASWTDYRLLQCKFRDLATVHVFQCDLVNVVDRPGFLWAGLTHATTKHASETSTAAEELREEILRVHAAGAATLFQAFFAILIVQCAFLGVGQNLVRV